MDRSLFDTSAISDVIAPQSRRSTIVSNHFIRYLAEHDRLTFSQISCYEILRGLRKKNAKVQLERFAEFCHRSYLLPVTYSVLDRAAELWADGQRRGIIVEDSDLIIAATALGHGLPLITANPRHFDWITDLATHNWRQE